MTVGPVSSGQTTNRVAFSAPETAEVVSYESIRECPPPILTSVVCRLINFDGSLPGVAGFEVAFGDEHDSVDAEAQTLRETEPVTGSVGECCSDQDFTHDADIQPRQAFCRCADAVARG